MPQAGSEGLSEQSTPPVAAAAEGEGDGRSVTPGRGITQESSHPVGDEPAGQALLRTMFSTQALFSHLKQEIPLSPGEGLGLSVEPPQAGWLRLDPRLQSITHVLFEHANPSWHRGSVERQAQPSPPGVHPACPCPGSGVGSGWGVGSGVLSTQFHGSNSQLTPTNSVLRIAEMPVAFAYSSLSDTGPSPVAAWLSSWRDDVPSVPTSAVPIRFAGA